ncbi:MAG: segregation/condensation protein A [Candidatus Sungbacteria bacterium]|nr:segregation/condensation protein A [Candidatus Sungbacteria bacterium]
MNFEIRQEKFEGPLELLVELIETEKLAVSEISLSKVTDDYIRYVRSLEKIDPEVLAEFLVVAAQLMLVKSRSLLPGIELTREDEAAIGELGKRLEQYKRFRDLAGGLKTLEKRRAGIVTREHYAGMEPIFYPPSGLTADLLGGVVQSLLAAIPKVEKLAEDKIRRIVSLEDRIASIRIFLDGAITKSFSEIVKNTNEKVDVIISFLAILELAKQKFVELDQKGLFEDIEVRCSGSVQ